MFNKNYDAWQEVVKLANKGNLSKSRKDDVVKVFNECTVWSKKGYYYMFPTVNGIDFSNLNSAKQGFNFPKIIIAGFNTDHPTIKFWGQSSHHKLHGTVLSSGVKVGKKSRVDLDNIDLEDEIIKGLI